MAISPVRYAKERIKEKQSIQDQKYPVVTISREVGCPAKVITRDLVALINRTARDKWSCVSKEILYESAKELGIPPSDLKYFFKYHEHGVLDSMLNTVAKFYTSDHKIYRSVEKAVSSFAQHGHVVIVGRGAAAILKDHQNALHIRLMAPLRWRQEKIMEYYHLGRKEALKFINDYDQKRARFMQHFTKTLTDPSLFDVIFNCETFTKQEILRTVMVLMKEKNMIQ